jgi:hypothetical protein
MRNHRTKDPRKPFRSGVSGDVSGFSTTFQNNRLSRIDIGPDKAIIRILQEFESNESAAARNMLASIAELHG